MVQRIRRMKDEEGLTLIEILVVLIILGILAGLVIFGISTFRDDTAEVACRTDGKSVETASEAYRAKFDEYALTIGALVDPDEDPTTSDGYLKEVPDNDGYTITYPGADGPGHVTGALDDNTVCYDSAP